MNNESKNNKNLIYAIVGVLTLMVAVVGATFAYFATTEGSNSVIIGNMASIKFDMNVTKKTSADNTSGLIPMSNLMVEKAVSNASNKGICVDDNGNAVCQIYKINVYNSSSATMFVDGYVTLTDGSGTSADDEYPSATTTMRWAQAFCTESGGNLASCTTAGAATSRQTPALTWDELGKKEIDDAKKNDRDPDPHNKVEILDTHAGVVGTGTIQGNSYDIINKNYIRVSKHTGTNYKQDTDVTSALVYNQFLSANDGDDANNDGDKNSTFKDAQVYYIVVWLSETGANQTSKENGGTGEGAATNNAGFFSGSVTFNSSDGNQITSKFNGWTSAA